MRKFLFYLSALCLCLAFVACDDDDYSSEVFLGNREYTVRNVEQHHWGPDYDENGLIGVDLVFNLGNGTGIYIETLVSSGDALKEGIYTFSSPLKDRSIRYAEVLVNDDGYEITEIIMSVAINKDIYTISIEGIYEDNRSRDFLLNYKGKINYVDYVVKPNGQGTITYGNETYPINVGKQFYFGGNNTLQIVELVLCNYENEDIEIHMDMLTSGGDNLRPGAYYYSEEGKPFTFNYGGVYGPLGGSSIVDGEVEVSISGGTYIIYGEGECYNGVEYSFTYQGVVQWFDERELGDRNYASKKSKLSTRKRR